VRSAEQIGRTPGEYHDWQAAQRQKALREVLAMLRRARDEGAEWYRWIEDGRPPLTQAEYDALDKPRRKR